MHKFAHRFLLLFAIDACKPAPDRGKQIQLPRERWAESAARARSNVRSMRWAFAGPMPRSCRGAGDSECQSGLQFPTTVKVVQFLVRSFRYFTLEPKK